MVVPPIISDDSFTNSTLYDASVNAGVIQLSSMPIKLFQPDGTPGLSSVIEHYQNYQSSEYNDSLQRMAELMSELVRQFDQVAAVSSWYWHTSHLSLCLDRVYDPPHRCIEVCSLGGAADPSFAISYKMKAIDALWPDSRVQMNAVGFSDALAAIQLAVDNCCDAEQMDEP